MLLFCSDKYHASIKRINAINQQLHTTYIYISLLKNMYRLYYSRFCNNMIARSSLYGVTQYKRCVQYTKNR